MKNKIKAISLVIIASFGVFFVLFSQENAKAEDADSIRIFVDASAVPPGDGTRERPYVMIGQALDELRSPSNEKSEVWIAGTHYSMALDPSLSGTPEQPLIFKQWEGQDPAIIDHRGDYGSAIITSGATDIVFDGISSRNTTGSPGGLPLFVNGSKRITVMNGEFSGGEESGTCLSRSSDIVVKNNVFRNNMGSGLLVPNAQNITITDNVFRENGGGFLTSGVFVSQSVNVTFERNVIAENPSVGFNATLNSENLLFNENIIYGNVGNGVQFDGVQGSLAIINNQIVNHSGIGLSVRMNNFAPSPVSIVGNVIIESGQDGMSLSTSSPSNSFDIANNTVLSNVNAGIYLSHRESKMRVFNNILAGNKVGAQFNTSNVNQITSNFNDLFGNETMLEFSDRPFGPWSGWPEWKAKGKDQRSLNVDPGFSNDRDCFGLICANFHLRKTSPLVEAGRSVLGEMAFDIDGDPRTFHRLDIGADEVIY